MDIASDLQKLISLRDSGDLSQTEFERAKALVLAERFPEAQPPPLLIEEVLQQTKKKRRSQPIAAVCATVAAALSAVSAIIDPNPLAVGSVFIWVVAAILCWISFLKSKKEIEKREASKSVNR